MDKDIDVWKQRNEILHKKVERQIEEIRKLQKENQELTNEMVLIKGITVTNSPELREANKKIKELENRLAEALTLDESHHQLNGKLQVRVTELEQENLELYADNKKISKQVEDQLDRARKAGL
jgi:predicted HicB family RNase H-like nuclease